MQRLSRRTWAVIGALLVAISITIACGDPLPAPGEATTPAEAGSEATSTEASTETDAGTDSASDGHAAGDGACTTELPYGDAAPLDNFDGLGAVSSVRLNRDGGTTAYLSSDLGNATGFDIGELAYPPPPSPLPASVRSTTAQEENPAPLADEKTVFWDEPIADGGARRIFSSTRANPGQNLESPVQEQIPRGTKTQALMPWSVAGTDVLYFVIRNEANNTADIHRGVRSGGSWVVSTEIDGAFDETHPVVTDDEMVMYFARNDSGKRKVYLAKRSAPGAPWENALEMQGDVNTPDHDSQPTWISPDQCTLIFTSNRGGGMRPYKIVRVRQ